MESLRSPEMKKMMTGKAKADASFIRGLSRHMSKRRVSFSGGLIMSAEAQVSGDGNCLRRVNVAPETLAARRYCIRVSLLSASSVVFFCVSGHHQTCRKGRPCLGKAVKDPSPHPS